MIMNGYKLFAESYRTIGETRKANLYELLGELDDEDVCTLFDSTAFNEIARSYLRIAVRELVSEDTITEEQAKAIRNRFSLLFDKMSAEDVVKSYKDSLSVSGDGQYYGKDEKEDGRDGL